MHSSLTFRWHYWVGSAAVFRAHPWRGVGWANFGWHYLAHRLPIAPEEIQDPHNFLVRFFTELGLVGGLLCVVWQMRLWWELTRPITPGHSTLTEAPRVIPFVAAVAGSGIVFGTVVAFDWSTVGIEDFLRRTLYFGAILLAASLTALRSLQSQEADDRPAPWLLRTILVAVGVFLVHNLIDFSLFEIGPMLVFSILTGTALGMRQPPSTDATPRRLVPAVLLAFSGLACLTATFGLWLPFHRAERASLAGDDAIRGSRFAEAKAEYEEADRAAWHWDADYAARAAKAAAAFTPPDSWVGLVSAAIHENPRDEKYWAMRAEVRMRLNPPPSALVKSDYETALRLNPNNVRLRIEFADALATLNDAPAAVRELEMALRFDDQLDRAEKKRMKPEDIARVKEKIASLRRADSR